jgi:hypothetical protein
MKKIYLLSTALMLGASSQAQQTIDFESFNLDVESYDNGSDGNGAFIFESFQNDISFTNNYDSEWGSWSGYAISNMTDTITPGWNNQYSAFTGEGFGGSSNYAVGYQSGSVSCENELQSIVSLEITNATYTAISMRDGDLYAKKFGSLNDANGLDDGTNGEDFYRIWIYCEDFLGINKDTIEVLLADYRFTDNTQDYIVKDWKQINISDEVSFPVSKITFSQESSDNGAFGMNTPAYYVVDDIKSVMNPSIGISENNLLNLLVYPNPVKDRLKVLGETGILKLTDLSGDIILSQNHSEVSNLDFSDLSSGIYLLSITNKNGKFSQKIVK